MWILGLAFGLFGSIGVNTGNNLQSLGLHKLHEREAKECAPGETLPNSASVIWVIGTSLFVAGERAKRANLQTKRKMSRTSERAKREKR